MNKYGQTTRSYAAGIGILAFTLAVSGGLIALVSLTLAVF